MLFNSFALLGLLGAIARAETEGVSDVNSFALSNNGGCKCVCIQCMETQISMLNSRRDRVTDAGPRPSSGMCST